MIEGAQVLELPTHIVPMFGPEHECSKDCWCHPALENKVEVLVGEHVSLIYVHNVAH